MMDQILIHFVIAADEFESRIDGMILCIHHFKSISAV